MELVGEARELQKVRIVPTVLAGFRTCWSYGMSGFKKFHAFMKINADNYPAETDCRCAELFSTNRSLSNLYFVFIRMFW